VLPGIKENQSVPHCLGAWWNGLQLSYQGSRKLSCGRCQNCL